MSADKFYDDFLSVQIESGINDRIHALYKKVLNIGLKNNEQLLEVGCGIGALTFLLARKVKSGVIEAFDPSPKSIAFAEQNVARPNVHFSTGDVLTYAPTAANRFDKVLLFDVLEHIPESNHSAVFRKLESFLKEDGLVLINIPNPSYILYDQQHHPEVLQELDQPVFLEAILPKVMDANLELFYFETHSVWAKDDYQFMILRKKRAFEEILLSVSRSLFQKAVVRLRRTIRNQKYRLP